ncbi:hypothetical protein HK101_007618 [Irineochytrium annulatum]|nr:hypothetical protein HK101_007618 [Irineochytrium annulatum]
MLAAGHPINDTAPTDATASPVVAGHTVDEVVAALQGLTPTKTNIRGPPLRAPQPAKSPRPPSSSSSSGLPRASSAPGKASSPSVMPRKSPAASHPAQSADPASPPSTITGNARDRVTFSDASSPPSVTGGTAAKGVGQPQRPPWNPDTLTPSKKRESSLIGPGKRIDRSPTTPRPQEGGGGAACREVNQLRGHRTAEVAQGKNAFMMQIEDLSKKPLTGEGVNGIAPAAEPVDRMVVDHDWTMGPPPPVPKRSALRKALEDEKKLVLKMLDDINAKETKIEALEAKLKRGADKAIKDTNVEELVNERLREKEVEHQEALKALTDRFTAMNYTLSKKLDFALSMLDDEQRLAVSKCTYLDTIGVKIADKSEDPASSNSASVMQMMSAITLDEEGMETS